VHSKGITVAISAIPERNLRNYSQEMHRLLEAGQGLRGHLLKQSPFADHEDQVECLPRKHKTLCPIHRTAKTKTKKIT
jgi:hypothetical protein